ncbi:unnamed protein product [Clonostachys rosea]|uniref:Uncharacterized protein n=1 Tax=Bionectria ochroleuca TaxID=29856 RepID=A0ABY6TSC8_BIOOC|nr:unnamed protein product [Clonostachys rosea]
MSDQHHRSSRRSQRNGSSSESRHHRTIDGSLSYTPSLYPQSDNLGTGISYQEDFQAPRTNYHDGTIHGYPSDLVNNRYAGQSLYSQNEYLARDSRRPQNQHLTSAAYGSPYGQPVNGQPAPRRREETRPYYDDFDSTAGHQGSASSGYPSGQSRPRHVINHHESLLPSGPTGATLDIRSITSFTPSSSHSMNPRQAGHQDRYRETPYQHRADNFLSQFDDVMFGSSRRDDGSHSRRHRN